MNVTTIILAGPGGSAVLTFSYRDTLFYGEWAVRGNREIADNFKRQQRRPQAILGPVYSVYPMEKGYYHFYAAARNTANELGLSFEVENSPVCYTPEVIRGIEVAMSQTVDRLADDDISDFYSMEYKQSLSDIDLPPVLRGGPYPRGGQRRRN